MKTAYYTFTTWDGGEMAAGSESAADGARRAVMVRQPEEQARAAGGENVIDLNAWRAAELCLSQEEAADQQAGPAWDEGEPEPVPPASRRRRSRRTISAAELVSTISVVAAAAAIVLRVLTS